MIFGFQHLESVIIFRRWVEQLHIFALALLCISFFAHLDIVLWEHFGNSSLVQGSTVFLEYCCIADWQRRCTAESRPSDIPGGQPFGACSHKSGLEYSDTSREGSFCSFLLPGFGIAFLAQFCIVPLVQTHTFQCSQFHIVLFPLVWEHFGMFDLGYFGRLGVAL